MRFLHVGDLHLGRSLGDFDLYEDQAYILDQLIEIAMDRKADGILIAGDIYNKADPSEKAIRLLDAFFRKLSEKKLKVFAISGNHDSDERLNFGSSLFEANDIFISAKFSGKLLKQVLYDAYGRLNVYLMPFIKASQVRACYPDAEIRTYDDAVRTVIGASGVDPAERNLILAHQFVVSTGKKPDMGGSEGIAAIQVGLVEQISADCFDDFDYAALGHIHKAQPVGRETVRYAGSPLKYALSECRDEKSVPVITIREKGDVEVELVSLKPKRDLRHLIGRMGDLLNPGIISDDQDYIYATLTDEDYLMDVMTAFQQFYPYTVSIDYQRNHSEEEFMVDLSESQKEKTFTQMISEFYRKVYGEDISEEELQVMLEVAREAGAADETH